MSLSGLLALGVRRPSPPHQAMPSAPAPGPQPRVAAGKPLAHRSRLTGPLGVPAVVCWPDQAGQQGFDAGQRRFDVLIDFDLSLIESF